MITEEKAIEILRRHAPYAKTFEIVLAHAQKVEEFALKMAKQLPNVDMHLIKTGSLLHDIGRFIYPPGHPEEYKHGVAGGVLLRKENLPKHAAIAERHVGAGITKKEILKRKLQLPPVNYVPITIEEKIICYADKRVEHNNQIVPLETVAKRFDTELGKVAGDRIRALHQEIQTLLQKAQKQKKSA